MTFISKTVPKELKDRNQWVCYRTKKTADKTFKYMISPKTKEFAKSNDSSTWSSYEEAYLYMIHHKMEGLAFVLTEGITFIDIDHAISNDGIINEIGANILNLTKDTYAEKSCSGHGIHIFALASMPKDAMKRNDSLGLEMYETKRFACITGDVINERYEVLNKQNEINLISENYVGKYEHHTVPTRISVLMDDNEIITKINNSNQKEKFNELFSGDISRYPSWSNADYALVKLLAFWTQNPNQIDAIFRNSGLYREKWDRQLGDSTYGAITIDNAIRSTTKTYKSSHYEYE